MRHRKSGRRLGRTSSHRKAMYRNMVTSLILHGRITTTEAKAKELRRVAAKVVGLGKRVPLSSLEGLTGGDLATARAKRVHAIRLARRYVTDEEALGMLFGEYAERFKSRPGGYTRIYKLGFRSGDDAPMSLIEFMPEGFERAVSTDDAGVTPPAVDAAPEE